MIYKKDQIQTRAVGLFQSMEAGINWLCGLQVIILWQDDLKGEMTHPNYFLLTNFVCTVQALAQRKAGEKFTQKREKCVLSQVLLTCRHGFGM